MDEAQLKKKISRFIFPLALILPGLLMIANPAYDELWSLIFFSPLPVRQILTDLALPNNHPLNTFFLKLLSSVSDNPLILRLPSLICGAFVPVFCGELAYRWSRKNRLGAMIAAAVLAAFSVPLAVYCGQARGYAMQLFFLLICILGSESSMLDTATSYLCCAAFFTVFVSLPLKETKNDFPFSSDE